MLKMKPAPMILGLLSIALICGCEPEPQQFTSANTRVIHDVTFGSAPLAESAAQRTNASPPLHVRPAPMAPSARKATATPRPVTARPELREGGAAGPTLGGTAKPGRMLSGVRQQSGTNSVNPMRRVPDDALPTFSIDVDTGSYTHARLTIKSGVIAQAHMPSAEE